MISKKCVISGEMKCVKIKVGEGYEERIYRGSGRREEWKRRVTGCKKVERGEGRRGRRGEESVLVFL